MKKISLDIRDKVLLFDFDGTLVETEHLAQKVIEEYFSDQHYPHRAPSDMIVGRTWQAAIASMREDALKHGVTLAAPEEMLAEFRRRYHVSLENGVKLIPGILECIPHFVKDARFLGIVTGSFHDEVQTALKAHDLGRYFERIWAVGDYEKSKPDPSPYFTAVRDLQVSPKDVIVFEDSVAGMESASRAGLSFVQISHEAHSVAPDARALKTLQNWHEFFV